MKNSSKNNYSGKNSKQYKRNPDFFSKNSNSPKVNNRFIPNSAKNENNDNFTESKKNKNNFSS